MSVQIVHSYSVHQWVSCGFCMVHPDWSFAENQKWLGSLYSPEGCGGNFLLTGTVSIPVVNGGWPQVKTIEGLQEKIQDSLKVWDHRFLNEMKWESSVLTLEALGQGLWSLASSVPLPNGVVWESVCVDLGERLKVSMHGEQSLTTEIGFRIQSLILKTGIGVDAELSLELDGLHWQSQPSKSCTPIGDIQAWASGELAEQLQSQPIDDWLGAMTLDSIPEKLFPVVKRKFSTLRGLKLSDKAHAMKSVFYERLSE